MLCVENYSALIAFVGLETGTAHRCGFCARFSTCFGPDAGLSACRSKAARAKFGCPVKAPLRAVRLQISLHHPISISTTSAMRPETLRAAHPHLTWPGYFANMPVAFWADLTIVGFGTVDLIMVVPFGAAHLAALEQQIFWRRQSWQGGLGFIIASRPGRHHRKAQGFGTTLLLLCTALAVVATGLTARSLLRAKLVPSGVRASWAILL
jgi:hypothetical protein